MIYTKENIEEGIIAKINSINDEDADEGMKRIWRNKFVNYPIEVEQNVLEWINNQPITDIDCHGESIRRVLDIFELDDSWFPIVLENFILFKNSGFRSNGLVVSRLC